MKRNNTTLEEIYSDWLVTHKFDESIALLVCLYAKWLDKPFYRWVRGYCTYDSSGYLVKTDSRIVDCCSSFDAVSDAYTGESMMSYVSGCSLFYQRIENAYEDELDDLIFNHWLEEFVGENTLLVEKYATETVGMELDEKLDYLMMENLVGLSGFGLGFKMYFFVKKHSKELFEQIMMIYAGTKYEVEGAEN